MDPSSVTRVKTSRQATDCRINLLGIKAALRAARAGAPRWGPALRALRALRAPHRTPAHMVRRLHPNLGRYLHTGAMDVNEDLPLLRVMADYSADPIWTAAGEVDLDTLPISDRLRRDLRTWADIFDTPRHQVPLPGTRRPQWLQSDRSATGTSTGTRARPRLHRRVRAHIGSQLTFEPPTRRGSIRQALRAGQALSPSPVQVHTPCAAASPRARTGGPDSLSGLPTGSAMGRWLSLPTGPASPGISRLA